MAARRPPGAQEVPGQRQRRVELVELVVHGDPDGLEDALGRVAAAEAGGRRARRRLIVSTSSPVVSISLRASRRRTIARAIGRA